MCQRGAARALIFANLYNHVCLFASLCPFDWPFALAGSDNRQVLHRVRDPTIPVDKIALYSLDERRWWYKFVGVDESKVDERMLKDFISPQDVSCALGMSKERWSFSTFRFRTGR